jgi:hypothetical protein
MRFPSVLRYAVLLVLIVAAGQLDAQERKGDGESVQSSGSYENFGLYEWSPWQDAWVLVYATYEDFAEWEPMTEYDHYLPPSVFNGGGGGEHEMPQGDQFGRSSFDGQVQSQVPLPLPPMVVTAPRPENGVLFLTVFRPVMQQGGDGSGFARVSAGTINASHQAAQDITCATEQEIRSHEAGRAYILARGPLASRNGVTFRVTFPSGATQTFRGISNHTGPWAQPISECQGG